MRYTVHDRHGGLLALLGFSTAARKLAPRDRFIGWTRVGITQGRGRYDRHKQYAKPKKAIWPRPLCKNWKRILNR